MAFDYKKEYKEFYMPKNVPSIVEIPKMNYIAVRGKGNPNDTKNGEYQNALGILYALSFTIKMSKLGENKIDGYFEYVVPPLEGLWWGKENQEINYEHKEDFEWISMIRQPEFVTKEVFEWALQEVKSKKICMQSIDTHMKGVAMGVYNHRMLYFAADSMEGTDEVI